MRRRIVKTTTRLLLVALVGMCALWAAATFDFRPNADFDFNTLPLDFDFDTERADDARDKR